MEFNKQPAGGSRPIDTSKLDVASDCAELVQEALKKLDAMGPTMASVHLSQALESIRTLQARISSGFE